MRLVPFFNPWDVAVWVNPEQVVVVTSDEKPDRTHIHALERDILVRGRPHDVVDRLLGRGP